jgi:hypothetical protein
MKRKYEIKKPILPSTNPTEQTSVLKCTLQICDKPIKIVKSESSSINETKHEMFASTKDEKVIQNLLDSNCKFFIQFIFIPLDFFN